MLDPGDLLRMPRPGREQCDVLDGAALDLDDGDAHPRPHHDAVGLAITPVVGEPQLR